MRLYELTCFTSESQYGTFTTLEGAMEYSRVDEFVQPSEWARTEADHGRVAWFTATGKRTRRHLSITEYESDPVASIPICGICREEVTAETTDSFGGMHEDCIRPHRESVEQALLLRRAQLEEDRAEGMRRMGAKLPETSG